MRLATVPGPTRDGTLVLVDGSGSRLRPVPEVAPDLRTALEGWDKAGPALARLAKEHEEGGGTSTKGVRFLAPLPRSTSWVDGSAFIQHIVLVRKARGAKPPEDLRDVPLMYQGVSDPLLPPTDPITAEDEAWGIDFEAEVAVILDDVPKGVSEADAAKHIKLLCLMNDVSLRNLIPAELARGFGFYQSKPPSHLAPFAVTPEEVGDAWRDGRLHLPLTTHLNGELFGNPDAGEMFFSFPRLIAHAARTRPLPAGTILGSGTVSNEDERVGSSCLAEKRMLETIKEGKATTAFLRFGDHVRIEMLQGGRSVFGAIDQEVVRYP